MKTRTIALGIALLLGTNLIAHAQTDSRVYAPNELILGMTYGDWSAAWWQFYLQIPNVKNSHPFAATDSACNNGNQPAGPVSFLAAVGSQTSPPPQIVRICNVPQGSPILFPIVNNEVSNLETKGGDADLRTGAALPFKLLTPPTMNVSLDGVSIGSLSQFRFESPVFPFTAPSPLPNFFFYTRTVSNNSSSPVSVSDGYWIAIKPLPVGQHTLSFSASIPGIININMLYYLTVQ
ncbi:hypothetical protein [Paraburkholderia hospita]|uniref:hypothetical protein n=1 Tax=Paraburkholderia hospita TaxID=169430 RepID=UPI00027158FB|nr:hypothetical protein [Paraburkholderia hospita]EUC18438.1 hypothetical protein PMI06_003344 [Burkholderia sp. BT03]SKC77087.1 hypothetical protein SAMN06266956_3019 [Paraburkholderia hospita]